MGTPSPFEAAAALALLALCIARPLYRMLGSRPDALGLDQIGISTNGPIELDPFTEKTHFFVNLNSVARRWGLYLNFMEVMLVTCWLSWGVRRLKAGTLQWRGGGWRFPWRFLGSRAGCRGDARCGDGRALEDCALVHAGGFSSSSSFTSWRRT